MSTWIEDPLADVLEELQQVEDDKVENIQIQLFISPYDVPDAVRSYFDEKKKRFVIDFKYIGNEDWLLQRLNEFLSLRLGKNSERLYGMEFDINGLKAQSVQLEITVKNEIAKAVSQLYKRVGEGPRYHNYRLVNETINRRFDELFAGTGVNGDSP